MSEQETVSSIVVWLRWKASRVIQEICPADAREAEDCNLLMASLTELADAIERGDWKT